MNKIKLTLFAALFIVGLASCQKKEEAPKVDAPKSEKQEKPAGMTIAYVDIDSLMTKYEFCKDYTAELTKKSESYKRTLTSKGNALQQAAMNFQERIQKGEIATEEEAMKQQASLQKQQENLQKLQEDLAVKFEEEQLKYNNALRDSVQHFLKEYNKAKKFSMIISKAGDNVLYADQSLDITEDVIKGLNKRYKK